jgi:GTP-binding protein HflX
VGFISDLPTELIAAFRATLEEVVEADIILHVRDISNEMHSEQRENVLQILRNLGMADKLTTDYLELLNKTDLVENFGAMKSEFTMEGMRISAATGAGLPDLLHWLDEKIAGKNLSKKYTLEVTEGKKIAWLYENALVEKFSEKNDKIIMQVNISAKNAGRFEAL